MEGQGFRVLIKYVLDGKELIVYTIIKHKQQVVGIGLVLQRKISLRCVVIIEVLHPDGRDELPEKITIRLDADTTAAVKLQVRTHPEKVITIRDLHYPLGQAHLHGWSAASMRYLFAYGAVAN